MSQDSFGLEESGYTDYALDSQATIDLCLARRGGPRTCSSAPKAAIKLHTLLDLRGNIPTFIHISDGRWHDVRVLDELVPEPGAFYVLDRGYIHFARLHRLSQGAAFFVVRARAKFQFRRIASRAIDKTTGLRCDQTIRTAGQHTATDYPDRLRRVRYRDPRAARPSPS